jgi:hypothetical protein
MAYTPIHILREEQLYGIWQAFCSARKWAHDKRLRGLYAGTLNKSDGPDFQGAEFQLDGKIFRGDIEIHKKTSDWYAHGHHLDRRYNSVLLHLVWQEGQGSCVPVLNCQNLPITTYSMKTIISSVNPKIPTIKYSSKDELTGFLKQMAIVRLTDKSRQAAYYCEKEGFDQALYCLILRILGVPNNSNNFERLAQIFPWHHIQYFKHTHYPNLNYWLSLFFTGAGLSHRMPGDDSNSNIMPFPLSQLLPGEIWQHSGQRPGNSPAHHLQGLAQFIYSFQETSLYRSFNDIFKNRWAYPKLYRALCQRLSVHVKSAGNNYWGRIKITEIIGNVLIPFFYYLANDRRSDGFSAYLEDFFLYLPATGSYAKLHQIIHKNQGLQEITNRFYINQALLAISNRSYCL